MLNYSELARDAGLSVDTSRRYLEYLNISYQVILLQPYYRNITSSLVKTPKIYWLDIGLLRMLCGFSETEYGPIYETLVVAEFHKWIKTMQRPVELYFYRTRSQERGTVQGKVEVFYPRGEKRLPNRKVLPFSGKTFEGQ